MKNYYSISVYSSNPRVGGVHIIKAQSEKTALAIRECYGISNPRFATGNLRIVCRKLDMRFSHNKRLIKLRKQGISGSIWYEDRMKKEKAELCKET